MIGFCFHILTITSYKMGHACRFFPYQPTALINLFVVTLVVAMTAELINLNKMTLTNTINSLSSCRCLFIFHYKRII